MDKKFEYELDNIKFIHFIFLILFMNFIKINFSNKEVNEK